MPSQPTSGKVIQKTELVSRLALMHRRQNNTREGSRVSKMMVDEGSGFNGGSLDINSRGSLQPPEKSYHIQLS